MMSKLITEKVIVKDKKVEVVKIREGPRGEKGDTGEGVASGGTAGQVLIKQSDNDFDTTYANPYRTIVSLEEPEGLLEGDIWIKVEEE